MTRSTRSSPEGVAFYISEDGTLIDVIHDSFDLFLKGSVKDQSFISCLKGDNVEKGYNLIRSITSNGVAYNWQLHVEQQDFTELFNFSGTKTEKGIMLIGVPDLDNNEQFLNGLIEMNNEQANRLRFFMKQHQGDSSNEDERNLYEDMSAVNNELANMQRKLTKKTAELERTNERKNQMMGMAAHDLRNPLNVILNYAEFLIDDHVKEKASLNEDQFQMIKQMKESSEYMVQVVEDILDISAIQSGSINLEMSDENIDEIIERVVSLKRPTASKKDISIITNLPNQPVVKEIDAHKFQQVLDNLISNAVKYSEFETEVEVGIREESDGAITIYVQDEGQGIPEGELSDLFVPFSKISVEATAGEKSTGLGLAIVQKIVEAHGGEIDVESEVGVGSTFSVNIP